MPSRDDVSQPLEFESGIRQQITFREMSSLPMRQPDPTSSDAAGPQGTYVSTVEADSTAKIIIRGAGILTLGSLLLGLLVPSESSATTQDIFWISLAVLAGALLIFLGPRGLRTTAKVSTEEVSLFSTGFRARFPLPSIESVSDSYFPSGGYGYRYLGKGHRGFISGGEQVDIKLDDGREYTVSVNSAEDFCAAVESAKSLK